MVKFSLSMCVYAKENPVHFARCVESILAQSVLPDEWIIVKDGPLTEGLEAIIRNISFPNELTIIALSENVTQGPARAEGVRAAQCEWIAIMDSDDICRPERFEKQLAMIDGDSRLSLFGGQIAEFADDPDQLMTARQAPLGHNEIISFMKMRNPYNCMTVMMRRRLALEAGNFRYFPWFEDYDLWARMIKVGAVCENTPDVLADVRVGGGMYARRRGVSYIRSEIRMQRQLKELGYIGNAGYVRNLALRVPPRLLPARGVTAFYNVFARKSIK